MPAVPNASPLIALVAIQRLDFLPALFETVLIPPAAAHEIRRLISVPPPWLEVQPLRAALPEIVLRRTLGDGEREAIALALEVHGARLNISALLGHALASCDSADYRPSGARSPITRR